MKKSVFLLFLLIFPVACGIYRTVTIDSLQLGMTKAEVENLFGRPEKIIMAMLTDEGRQEISVYKIGYNDLYTLEFMNDHLFRYEFLREEVVYVPRPPILPPPVFIIPPYYPVPPKPFEPLPPVTKPISPSPSVQPERPERIPNRERTHSEASETNRQGRENATNRQERENATNSQSNRDSRIFEGSDQN